MNQLQHLYDQLARLRAWRKRFSLATGWSAIGIAVLVALLAIFAIDWSFRQSVDLAQRLFLIALGVGGIVWATRRYALPWFGQHEDPIDLALQVDRKSVV